MASLLSADDLNDFISPGVACIKPVEPAAGDHAGEVDIQLDADGNPLEISKIDGRVSALTPAQISLSDCLACSGCITSAEEVLVAQHSHDQLLKALRQGDKTFVASISHQARASLAHAYGRSVEDMDRLLVGLFVHQLGFRYVVGTALGRKLSLLEEARATVERRQRGAAGPVLSAVCPGWVLYAEKTHPHVLPYMSAVKSAQQITGCLLKSLAAHELGVASADIYHLSIMPCFDKKLESARPEPAGGAPDVDCVLTAKELVNLIDTSEYSLVGGQPASGPLDDVYRRCAPRAWPYPSLAWKNDSGSESGGYAHNYLSLFKVHLLTVAPQTYRAADFSLECVGGRNNDVYELRLVHAGEKVASAAVVNGFRNIQNLVRRLKAAPKKANPLAARRRARATAAATRAPDDAADASRCDYVEVMACPGGCINGGGQISTPAPAQEKEWLAEVRAVYSQIEAVDLSQPDHAGLVQQLLAFSAAMPVPHSRLYATTFHAVEKPTDPNAILLGAKW